MQESTGKVGTFRIVVGGLVVVALVLGIALIAAAITRSVTPTEEGEVNALASSTNECVVCHTKETAGIVKQFGYSTMAAADVSCQDCHQVDADYPDAYDHEGTFVSISPSTSQCQKCHEQQVEQFQASRHALPAYVAMTGTEPLTPEQLAMYEAVPEGSFNPDRSRNSLYNLEGPDITRFACEGCHDIGKPHADGAVGQCQKCHLRHSFSIEQARKPETCNHCHIGPDHPQWEIYQESPHGIAYATMGHEWNWDAASGTQDSSDFAAATCATCHMSGFGGSPTTHDVGDRLTWYLFAPISKRRPDWEQNMSLMKSVCRECHNETFVNEFYVDADAATEAVNAWVTESNEIVQPLKDQGLFTAEPFDEPIDFVYFDLWHHWGRTAKFGSWMQGPDYVQWHGAYELLRELAELREMTESKLHEAGE
ncbi:MAG: multiheme c-type cytochrome [Chloroflexota bacterium]